MEGNNLNWSQIKRIISDVKNKHLKSFFQNQNDEQAIRTYIPICLFILNQHKIESICEPGSGYGSTSLLGSKSINQYLKKNVILENNPIWLKKFNI